MNLRLGLLLVAALASCFAQDPFAPACMANEDCTTGVCLTDGDNVNDDPNYFFCAEPMECGIYHHKQSFTGVCNNLNEGWRQAGSWGHFELRTMEANEDLPTTPPRQISDAVCAQATAMPNKFGISGLLIPFGQFLDHDITIVPASAESGVTIIEGSGDLPDFEFHSSDGVGEPPIFPNLITSYVDLSAVYGSDLSTCLALRSGFGGELLSTVYKKQEYLPKYYELESPGDVQIAHHDIVGAYAAGDIRVNENVVLTALHTLFLREHNRLAKSIVELHDLDPEDPDEDEQAFLLARRLNMAQYQNIVFNEFFPAVHGEPLPEYTGYDDNETADVSVFFSTASYRFGHSGVIESIRRVKRNGQTQEKPISEFFFHPSAVQKFGGVDALLKGALTQCQERIDTRVVESLRTFLFQNVPEHGVHGLDLASLNIQRGRDHQIEGYNDMREHFGLPRLNTFLEVTGGLECLADQLASLYYSVDDCDPWVCGLAEEPTRGQVGELFFAANRDQFRRFRDADRFYFENTGPYGPQFDITELELIRATTLADILARNTFLSLDPHAGKNYVEDAFQSTGLCCTSDAPHGMERVCVSRGGAAAAAGYQQYWEVDVLPHCEAMSLIEADQAFFPGTKGPDGKLYDCDCDQVRPPRRRRARRRRRFCP